MWLFTQHGFYSVMVDGENREYVIVCGRSLKHLDNLRSRFSSILEDVKLVEMLGAEYPYRLRIKRQQWISLMMDLAADVKYTNYQSAASRHMETIGPRFVVGLKDLTEAIARIFRRPPHRD